MKEEIRVSEEFEEFRCPFENDSEWSCWRCGYFLYFQFGGWKCWLREEWEEGERKRIRELLSGGDCLNNKN